MRYSSISSLTPFPTTKGDEDFPSELSFVDLIKVSPSVVSPAQKKKDFSNKLSNKKTRIRKLHILQNGLIISFGHPIDFILSQS
jgi:hypothetical protein